MPGAAGHGSGSSSATATAGAGAGDFDDVDVTFAQMMIPHHEQALEMAKSADGRASDSEVKEPAGRVEHAQGIVDRLCSRPTPPTVAGGTA
jgi:uncharacterized protein (DUF305 family)